MEINIRGKVYRIYWEILLILFLFILTISVILFENNIMGDRAIIGYSNDEISKNDFVSGENVDYYSISTKEGNVSRENTSSESTLTEKNAPTEKVNNTQTAKKININTASMDELMSLPSIGEVKAKAIIDFRTKNGPFKTIDELEKIKGIGPVILEKLRPLVTVD